MIVGRGTPFIFTKAKAKERGSKIKAAKIKIPKGAEK